MGKILQQLYRGDLCPAENTIRGNAEYDALTRQSMDDFNRFTDKLDRGHEGGIRPSDGTLPGAYLH
ncbi:MAG: DUF6809 family protein [Acutalibacteraceae bacterium]